MASRPGSARSLTVLAFMAYGNKHTNNNTAEYNGLLHGLRYAHQ